MIRDLPSGADLLAEASRVLRTNILPELTSKSRYDGLMILKAMDLAERELRADHHIENKLKQQLLHLKASEGSSSNNGCVLSSNIRNGPFDASEKIYKILLLLTAYKLKETNASKVSLELESLLDALS